MKKEYLRTLIILGIIILILINFFFFWIGYQNFLYPKLGEFEIVGIKEEQTDLVLETTVSHHAKSYQATIKKGDKIIFQTTSDNNHLVLENFYAEYNDSLTVMVVAFNKNKEKKNSQNTYQYQYKDATFEKEKDHYVAHSKDLYLDILGFDYTKDYQLELYYDQNKIYETEVNSEEISILREKVAGYSGRITAVLKNDQQRIVSKFNFYLNTPVVGKLSITSPLDNFRTRWNDINLRVKGGENANHYFVNLYIDDNLVNRFEVKKEGSTIVVPASVLEENTSYMLELEAVYEDYTEIAEKSRLNFSVATHETTKPVFVSHNPSFIKKGTKVYLHSMSDDVRIYYTLDGREPNQNSSLYQDPIVVNDNMVLKTLAVSKSRYNSAINTYDFQIRDQNLVVYLSPSNQDGNYGVRSTGFTTEMAMMNKVADVVQTVLEQHGVTVYRNNPNGDINAWTAKSNAVKADFHLAIHSNGSSHHTARGIEIYVDDETAPAFSVASNIYENLWAIYSGNDNLTNHRGVKYARGSLGEVNRNFLPCGALIEVAYHDEYNDALWITQNLDKIGQNIANSLISYYN